MKGYTYTITPDNKPLFILYSWASGADGSSESVNYTVNNFVPELEKESGGYSAVIARYPDIGLCVPLLKVQGFLIDAYLASGYIKKEDVVYVPYSEQLLEYIKTTIQPISEEQEKLAVDVGTLFPDYVDTLGNKYEGTPATKGTEKQQIGGTQEQPAPTQQQGSKAETSFTAEPEAVEFGGGYGFRFSERAGEAYQGAEVHPESNLTGEVSAQPTTLYDNLDRNRPMGEIPAEFPEEDGAFGEMNEGMSQIGGQIPMVYPPTGKGKVEASVQIADVRNLIPMNMPV